MQHTSFNSCVVTYKAIYYYKSTDAADCCDQVALNAKKNRVLIAQWHSALLPFSASYKMIYNFAFVQQNIN